MNENEILPKWEKKCWGWACHVEDGALLLSLLKVNAGWRCSIHKHAHRHNSFTVVSGKISIVEYKESESGPIGTGPHVLYPGDSFSVPPEIWHCFRVIEDGYVVETYHCDDGTVPDVNDIIRYDEGGRIT